MSAVRYATVIHDRQRNGNQARRKTDQQKQTANTFRRSSEDRLEMRKRNAEALEKLRGFFQIAQFAFAGEEKLPAPIEANDQEEKRLRDAATRRQPFNDFCDQRI